MKGAAHIGVLQALLDNGIKPDIICGASAGSIAGVMYADGLQSEEILYVLAHIQASKVFRPSLSLRSLAKHSFLKELLSAHISANNLEELSIPVIVAVSNLNTGYAEYHSEGAIEEIVAASSCIPIIFDPVNIGGNMYVDGGLLDNMPVKPLVELCENIIGVNLISMLPLQQTDLGNAVAMSERIFDMLVVNNTEDNYHLCDMIINPPEIMNYGVFGFKNGHALYEIGYNATMAEIDKIKFMLSSAGSKSS